MYQKTQVGTAMLVLIAIAYAIEFLVTVSNGPSSGVLVVSAVLACIGVVFSTMTIRVSTDGVEWWFTFGILHQRVSLAEIQFAVTKKVNLLNGLGIRTDGRNWLWIVNGSDAVQLDMRNGRRIMLGSAEAQTVTLFIDSLLNGG
jgi:hypothetical protein